LLLSINKNTGLDFVASNQRLGGSADGATAVTHVDASQPDVVLMDINMPGVNGIEATHHILSNHPQLGVIIVTMLEDEASVFAVMRARVAMY